jgi:hypothetical protein
MAGDCSECAGSGVVEDDATGAMGYVVKKTCPACGGRPPSPSPQPETAEAFEGRCFKAARMFVDKICDRPGTLRPHRIDELENQLASAFMEFYRDGFEEAEQQMGHASSAAEDAAEIIGRWTRVPGEPYSLEECGALKDAVSEIRRQIKMRERMVKK